MPLEEGSKVLGYRKNASKTSRGALRLCKVEKSTRGNYCVSGAFFWTKHIGPLRPPGRYKKEKSHTPHALGNNTEAAVGHIAIQQHSQGAQHR